MDPARILRNAIACGREPVGGWATVAPRRPQENPYNKTRTAASLAITFRALRYKLKKLGID